MNKRILLSSLSILASAAIVAGATFAFFSDSETSAGNTFTAGGLDLKIDSEAHYAGLVCGSDNKWVLEDDAETTRPDLIDKSCGGTWEETNLGPQNKFFNFRDLKPGDSGENTISLRVYDNDAWLRLVINNVKNLENWCTDPERDDGDTTCGGGDTVGELRENLQFSMWLDQGAIPGFQGEVDPGEGDNIYQEATELIVIKEGTIDENGEVHVAAEALAYAYDNYQCAGGGSNNDRCLGLTSDGHIVGGITYYIGVNWELPSTVTDIVQTDSLLADITFEIEQYRNNPSPSFAL